MGLCRQCDLLSHVVTYCAPVSYIVGLGRTLWGYVVFYSPSRISVRAVCKSCRAATSRLMAADFRAPFRVRNWTPALVPLTIDCAIWTPALPSSVEIANAILTMFDVCFLSAMIWTYHPHTRELFLSGEPFPHFLFILYQVFLKKKGLFYFINDFAYLAQPSFWTRRTRRDRENP